MLDIRRDDDKGNIFAEVLCSSGKRDGEITAIGGQNNILVIAPHGAVDDDDNTDIIAKEMADRFGFYAVTNTKYQKPETAGKKKPDATNFLLDLNIIENAKLVQNNQYLASIDRFIQDITKVHGKAIVFFIHGAKDINVRKAGGKILKNLRKTKPSKIDVLIGYGQWHDKNLERLSAPKTAVDDLISAFSQVQINAEIAPTKAIIDEGKKVWYCGNDPNRMNQYFVNNNSVDSIQLEFRWKGLRENSDMAREAAIRIGKPFSTFAVAKPAPDKNIDQPAARPEETVTGERPDEEHSKTEELGTTLSTISVDPSKYELKQIQIGEIDLDDTTFKFRTPDLDAASDNFELLKSSIRKNGILQNIAVRKVDGKEKYQLIAGFRRTSALKSIFEENGKLVDFQKQSVPAVVYTSLADDEAFQISFTENFERKNLSLWEIANSCRIIRDKMHKDGKSDDDAEKHLMVLIRKGKKTVTRYLQVSAIKNENVRRDLHTEKIDLSIARVFTREGLSEEDIADLYNFFTNNPLSYRQFDEATKSLLKLKEWSGLTVKTILEIPTAKEFLVLKPDELKEKIEYLQKARDKSIEYLLTHEIKNLKKPVDVVKSNDDLAPFLEQFSKKSKSMEEKMAELFKANKMPGSVSIGHIGDYSKQMVKLSIAAPATSIPGTAKLVAEEFNDDFMSLADLFKEQPKDVQPEKSIKVETKSIPDSTMGFTINLEAFQTILKDLHKDGGITDKSDNHVLIRTLSENRVQFGRWNKNGLLIDTEANLFQEGSAIIKLESIYAPIIKARSEKDAQCQIVAFNKILRVTVESTNFAIEVPTCQNKKLCNMFGVRPPASPAFRVEAADLRGALGKVLPCINPREIRKAMTGIFFKVDEKFLTMVGTNGILINEVAIPHSSRGDQKTEWIASFDAGALLKQILPRNSGSVGISVSENRIYFHVEGFLVTGKLIPNADYPSYHRMFLDAENSFKISLSKLKGILASLSEDTDREDNFRMTIKTNNNTVLFKGRKCSAEHNAEEIKGSIDLDVNAKFLAMLSGTLHGDTIEVRHKNNTNNITFHPEGQKQRALITTVRRR